MVARGSTAIRLALPETDAIAAAALSAMVGMFFHLRRYIRPYTVEQGSVRPRRIQLALLAVQAVTALVMLVLVCSGHEGALLVLVAAQLGWFMSLRRALLWVVIQAVLMAAILALGWPLAEILSLMATYVAFQVLALFSCFLAASEAGARSGLARANRELRATGELLANTSRMAERERNLARAA